MRTLAHPMKEPLRALFVEDSQDDADLLLRELRRGAFDVTFERVDTAKAMGAALDRQTWDIILCDYSMPGFSAPSALSLMRGKDLDLPFIIVSGTIGEEAAVEAMRTGVHDYILKNKLARFLPAVERELREAAIRREQRRMQAQLLISERMVSMGTLAAGVAHEINTPVQFVSDSVHFVRDAMKDLMGVIDKLQVVNRSVLDGTPSRTAAAEASEAAETADLSYLFENVPAALDRALEGLGRVTTIVRSMKEFAHPDQAEMTTVDLNRAIQTTLTIARSEYKYVADLETDFGDIPQVLCHAGDVNQAVLNIVVNASHAIADFVKGTDRKGRITVHTRREDDDVVIAIGDTGGGIPERIRGQIFDPFFTTKEIGKGTGQGLAISRSVIVGKHHGTLTFETAIGEGTTFFIRLPVSKGEERSASTAA